MFDFIAYPIGVVLKWIYDTLAFQNYSMAIVILTVTLRALVIPLYIRQMHSSSALAELQPEIQELQKKYAKDQTKLYQALMDLYKERGLNPMGGCLPMMIQIPILFSLNYVISQPLKYMLEKSSETINELFSMIPTGADKISNMKDISIISYFSEHVDRLKDAGSMLQSSDLLNMNFLGVNLGTVPTLNIHKYIGSSIHTNQVVLLAVPILAALTAYLSSKMATEHTVNQPQANNAATQKWILLILPLMTGYFAFSVPAGLGLYWIVGNVFLIFQQLIINKYVLGNKSKLVEGKKAVQKAVAVEENVPDSESGTEDVIENNVEAQEIDKPKPAEPL